MGKYFLEVLKRAFVAAILLFIAYYIFDIESGESGGVYLFLAGLFASPFIVFYTAHTSILDEERFRLKKDKNNTDDEIKVVKNELQEALVLKDRAEEEEKLWKQTLLERSSGYPTLVGLMEEWESYYDGKLAEHLATKRHPAYTAAQVVKAESLEKRKAKKEARMALALVDHYENIAPFLTDFRDELPSMEDEALLLEGYSEEEKQDRVTQFVTIQEYKKLSSSERNQRALDRFWSRNKSRWLIGRLYERFVGYLYEQKGYSVDYEGVVKGLEDLGRDLICTKGNEVIIIQCKNWAKFKTLHEKHIFQFFGTVFEYKDKYPDRNVKAIFYCTTSLSELANKFAVKLGVEVIENHIFDQGYPSIKCNISQGSGEKIYHLPFDQRYDDVLIESNRGEFYCKTVLEAEKMGFRRAYRWKGLKAN